MPVYLLLYVDDMLLVSKSMQKINLLKSKLSTMFQMKELGKARKILGMFIERDRQKCILKLHQRPYLERLVKRFSDLNCKVVSLPLAAHFNLSKDQCPTTEEERVRMSKYPYANAVGSIMYAMISTRPDLAYAISVLSRFMANRGYDHSIAIKWVISYIDGSLDVGLCYYKSQTSLDLVGYVDADFAGDKHSRKSTTSYMFTLAGSCILWKAGLQSMVMPEVVACGIV